MRPLPLQPDRRREQRYPIADAAEVVVLAEPSWHLEGRVLDVSRSGLRVAVRLALTEGTTVKITFRRPAVIVGEVRHCCRAGEVFHLGIQIRDVLISPNRHVDEDELALYVAARGLTEAEFFYVRLHFSECPMCQRRLEERENFSV